MDQENGNGHADKDKDAPLPPGYVPVRAGRKEFVLDRVMPVPCNRAPFVVWVDGLPYAGFGNRADAQEAMHSWRARWPAAMGRDFQVVER